MNLQETKHLYPRWTEQISKAVQRLPYERILQTIVALFAVGLVASLAFGYLFTTFVPWDDEGYFLLAYRDFLAGHAPYDQIYSFYGPVTFFGAGLLTGFDPVNVTHDYFRWVLLPLWILIAMLIAGVVWRWTGQFSLALVVFLLVGLRLLRQMAVSVGHPQVWGILAATVLIWLGLDWMYLPGKKWRGFWTGAVIGVIILCKINLGTFVFIGVGLAVSLRLRGRSRWLIAGPLMVAAAGLGLLLVYQGSTASERYFALAYLGSLAAIIGLAIVRSDEQQPSLTGIACLVAGLAICLCTGVGATLAHGTTIRALFRSLILEPAAMARSYHNPFQDATRGASLLLSAVAVGNGIWTLRWHRSGDLRPAWLGLLKVASGTGLLLAFCYNNRLALAGSLLFLWLLIFDVQRMDEPAYSDRLLLALLCPVLSLQLFPLAGAQVDWAALMPTAAAAVLLGDGISLIDREKSRTYLPRWARIRVGGIATVLAVPLLLFGGRDAMLHYNQWQNAQPVDLPGAHWLRLPPPELARLTVTVTELSRNCRAVLTLPGMYSFSLWSGVPPAEERRINSWPFLWPHEVQKEELTKLQHQDQGCVLVSWDTYQFFKGLAVSPGNGELLSEIQRTMTPIFAFQDLSLYKSSATPKASSNSAVPIDNRRVQAAGK